MNLDKVIKKEISYSYVYKVVGLFISFYSVPILINFLGKEVYGIWVTLFSMISWFLFLDFGLGMGLRNLLTKSISNKNFKLSKNLIANSYLSISIIVSFIYISLLILIEFFDWQSNLNTKLFTTIQLKTILRTLSLGFCLLLIFQLVNNMYFAVHRSSKVFLITTLRQLIVFIPIIFLSKSENNFSNLVYIVNINSFLPIIVLLFFSFVFFFQNENLRLGFKDFDFKSTKNILNLGGKFFVNRLSSVFLLSIIPFQITSHIGASQTADYNIGYKIFGITQMIFIIYLSPNWSAITEKYEIKDFKWIKNKLFQINKYSIIAAFFIILTRFSLPFIIPLWIGESIKIDYNVINWVAVLLSVYILTEPFLLVLNGIGEIKKQMYHSIAIILLLIPTSLFLLEFTDLRVGAVILPPIIFRLLRAIHALIEIKQTLNAR